MDRSVPRTPRPLAAPQVDVRLDARRAVRDLVFVMVSLELLVVLLDLWFHCGRVFASPDLSALFDASLEGGLASWLAVAQTTLVAVTLWAMAALYRHTGTPRAHRIGWTALAACFTYLAIDDGTELHERVGTAFGEATASGAGFGAAFPSYYWQLVLGPLFAVMGLFVLGFLWRALRTPRRRLLLCGALALLTLAEGMDFVEGLSPEHPLNVYAALAAAGNLEPYARAFFGLAAYDAVVHLGMVLEETIEMTAMTVLWAVFLLHLADSVAGVRLRWATAPTATASPGRRDGRPLFVDPPEPAGVER